MSLREGGREGGREGSREGEREGGGEGGREGGREECITELWENGLLQVKEGKQADRQTGRQTLYLIAAVQPRQGLSSVQIEPSIVLDALVPAQALHQQRQGRLVLPALVQQEAQVSLRIAVVRSLPHHLPKVLLCLVALTGCEVAGAQPVGHSRVVVV